MLEHIASPADIKHYTKEERVALAQEIRATLLERLSHTGGHFGPNFGLVEATIALHTVFSSPTDKLIFDISHNSYPHKMLTGRARAYFDSQAYNEVGGYTNPQESPHDHFAVGHTSTSVSLASGMALARDAAGQSHYVVAIIGDGALSGGEALEALDFAGTLTTQLLIVVNDNEWSIAENHGGLYNTLAQLRASGGTYQPNLFEAFGLEYTYLEDGHDCEALIAALTELKDRPRPQVLHIHTQKGKGYLPAEKNPEAWHACKPFEIHNGMQQTKRGETYPALTAEWLLERMKKDPQLIVTTAGVPGGIGFSPERRARAGKQYLDVGIAEEHAIALCSGFAAAGGHAVFETNATFMQRTYDQMSHDVCINGQPITVILYNASVYGGSDKTHLGIFIQSALGNIPGLVYLAPTNRQEYLVMLSWSIEQNEYPVVLPMPCIGVHDATYPLAPLPDPHTPIDDLASYQVLRPGSRVALIATGDMCQLGQELCDALEQELDITATLVNPRFANLLDRSCLDDLAAQHECVLVIEQATLDGGLGQKIAAYLGDTCCKVLCAGLKRAFYDRLSHAEVLAANGLTCDALLKRIRQALS